MSFVNYQVDLPPLSIRGDELYLGTVVNNNDPLQLGRVRVRVNQLMPEELISDSHCPWAVMRRSGWGSKVDRSEFNIPEVGSRVLVQFVGGSIYSPIYETAPVDSSTKLTPMATNYPRRHGWIDADGSQLIVDDLAHTVDYVHQSGVEVHIRGDKTVDINLPYNKHEVIGKNSTENVGADHTREIEGNETETIKKNETRTITGNVLETIGGTLTITATGSVVITGATVTIQPTTPGSDKVRLGSTTPTDFLAFKKALDDLKTVFDAHVHSGVSTGPGNTGISTTTMPTWSSGTHYSSDTKAK